MKILSNVHTHCKLCDGIDSPQEVVQQAIKIGFTDLGFSSHSYAKFDPECAGIKNEDEYCKTIKTIKEEYKSSINILCGIEADYYTPIIKEKYDYIIGSVHYLQGLDEDGKQIFASVDANLDSLVWAKKHWYNDDGLALAEDFFDATTKNICENQPLIVGHFDVVRKFNNENIIFDEKSKRYKDAVINALDKVLDIILGYDGMIEINTGAMARGFKGLIYPSDFILKHIAARGGRVIITSDCHDARKLTAYFDVALHKAKLAGFCSVVMLSDGEFKDFAI